jgi:hypothetical protein
MVWTIDSATNLIPEYSKYQIFLQYDLRTILKIKETCGKEASADKCTKHPDNS